MASPRGKNLEAISRAIDVHNKNCDFPPTGILMHPIEIDRLDWGEDNVRGVPLIPEPKQGTGSFRIICDKDKKNEIEEDIVEAIAEDRELETAGVGWPD